MSIPTAQTAALLASEALAKCGYSSPPSALTSRAEDQWMNEIKNDLMLEGKKIRSLNAVAVYKIAENNSFHEMPSNLLEVSSMTLLYGTTTGTTQNTPTKSTCQLAASYSDNDEGKEIVIENDAATHSYEHSITQIRTISSQTITYRPYLLNVPTSTVSYMVVDQYINLEMIHNQELDATWKKTNRGRPQYVSPLGDVEGSDSDTGYRGDFWLYPAPDKDYYMLMRYYLDLSQVDTEDLRLTNLYTKWRNLFIIGLQAKCFENDDDNRAVAYKQMYLSYLKKFADREQFGRDQKMVMRAK